MIKINLHYLKLYILLFGLLNCILSFDYIQSDEYYERKAWKHWIDDDKDCQNTRNEVLIRDSLIPVVFKDSRHCRVISGKWICPYTGVEITNPIQLDIDHLVPLKEAFDSGASEWTEEERKEFANNLSEPYHLLAVASGANRQKGAQDPAQWMPEYNQCSYLKYWVEIKKKYNLTMDSVEKKYIDTTTKRCVHIDEKK